MAATSIGHTEQNRHPRSLISATHYVGISNDFMVVVALHAEGTDVTTLDNAVAEDGERGAIHKSKTSIHWSQASRIRRTLPHRPAPSRKLDRCSLLSPVL